MGGNNAWKKRVAMGGLMKGAGGAALRHHPHLGRKGKEELKLNRLGNIGGRPNPKNKQQKKHKKLLQLQQQKVQSQQSTEPISVVANQPMTIIVNDNSITNLNTIGRHNNDYNSTSSNNINITINNSDTNKSIGENKKNSSIMQARKANITNKRLLSWKYRSIGFGCIAFL